MTTDKIFPYGIISHTCEVKMIFIILNIFSLGLSRACTPSGSGLSISPDTDIQTATGNNNTFSSEALYNSVKTIANFNFTGSAAALATLSVFLVIFIVAYKQLRSFIHLVNGRLHNLAHLFGIHGFDVHQPAIGAGEEGEVKTVSTVKNYIDSVC